MEIASLSLSALAIAVSAISATAAIISARSGRKSSAAAEESRRALLKPKIKLEAGFHPNLGPSALLTLESGEDLDEVTLTLRSSAEDHQAAIVAIGKPWGGGSEGRVLALGRLEFGIPVQLQLSYRGDVSDLPVNIQCNARRGADEWSIPLHDKMPGRGRRFD